MTNKRKAFRLRIKLGNSNHITYITRDDRHGICYFNGSETPLALSNLVGDQAAELRFNLQDCISGNRACFLVREAWQKHAPAADPHYITVEWLG